MPDRLEDFEKHFKFAQLDILRMAVAIREGNPVEVPELVDMALRHIFEGLESVGGLNFDSWAAARRFMSMMRAD